MNKLNNVVFAVERKADTLLQKVNNVILAKKTGDSGTIASLILIVIVVGLLITVKTAATGWVTTLVEYFNKALDNFKLS